MGVKQVGEENENDVFEFEILDNEEVGTKRVAVKEVRVCIFAKEVEFPNLGLTEVNPFLYCYPYKDEDGGMILMCNPIAKPSRRYRAYDTKTQLFNAFSGIRISAMRKNPNLILLYQGGILRDTTDVAR